MLTFNNEILYDENASICGCYWEEPILTAPVLICKIPEYHQIPLFSLFQQNEKTKSLISLSGGMKDHLQEDGVMVTARHPTVLNLKEGFSPPIPIWLNWSYQKYDEYTEALYLYS